jgi:hypothetical protein
MKMKKVVLALGPDLLKDKAVVAYALARALVWMKQKKVALTEMVYTFPLDIEFKIVVDEKRVLVIAKASDAYIYWRDNDEPVLLDKNFRPKPFVNWYDQPLPMSAFDDYRAYTEEQALDPEIPPPEYPDGYTLVPAEGVNERVMLAMRRAALNAGYWPAILTTHQYALIDSTTGWGVAYALNPYTSASINAYSPLLMMRTNGAYCDRINNLSLEEPGDPWVDFYKTPIYESGAAHTLTVRENGQVYNSDLSFSRPLDLCAQRLLASQDTEVTAVTESFTTYDPPACTWSSPSCHTHSEKRSSYAADYAEMEVTKDAPYYQYTNGPAEIRKAYDYDYVLTYSTAENTGGIVIQPSEGWTSPGKAVIQRWDTEFEFVRDWTGTYEFSEGWGNYSAGVIYRAYGNGHYYDFQLDMGPYYSRFSFAVGKHLMVTSSGFENAGSGDSVDFTGGVHFSPDFTEQYDDWRTTRIGYVRAEWTGPFERERLWDRIEGYTVDMVDHGWGFFDEAKQQPWRYDFKNSTCFLNMFEVGVCFIHTTGEEGGWSSAYLDWTASWSDPGFGNTSPLDSLALKKGFVENGFGQNGGAGYLTKFSGDFYTRSAAEEQWARDLRYEFDKTGEFLVDKDEAQTEWNPTTGDWDYPEGYVPPISPPDEEE